MYGGTNISNLISLRKVLIEFLNSSGMYKNRVLYLYGILIVLIDIEEYRSF
jgi:hypothetical protein